MILNLSSSDGVTQEELTTALADKQDTLVNGTGTTVLNNAVNIDTPVQGIKTQDEFDALPEDDQNKGLWVISDGGSGGGGVGNSNDTWLSDLDLRGTYGIYTQVENLYEESRKCSFMDDAPVITGNDPKVGNQFYASFNTNKNLEMSRYIGVFTFDTIPTYDEATSHWSEFNATLHYAVYVGPWKGFSDGRLLLVKMDSVPALNTEIDISLDAVVGPLPNWTGGSGLYGFVIVDDAFYKVKYQPKNVDLAGYKITVSFLKIDALSEVTEYDATGGWHVRKWANGYVEMSLKDTRTLDITRAYESIYIPPVGKQYSFAYPFTLTALYSEDIHVVSSNDNLVFFLSCSGGSLTKTSLIYPSAAKSWSNQSVVTTVRVTGRWK